MLFRIIVVSTLVFALSVQASAHALISPMLGVSGKPNRDDVQRPSKTSECGKVDIQKTIDSSTTVQAAADGTFNVTAINFNGGKDGSRKVTLNVDATGAGKNFTAGTIPKNGDSNPNAVGNEPIVAALPVGTKCTGGASKNLCLASFTTTSGFGNCVVVKQDPSDAGSAADVPPVDDNTEPPPPPVGVAGANSVPTSTPVDTTGQAAVAQNNKGKGRIGINFNSFGTRNVNVDVGNMGEANKDKNVDQAANMATFAAGTRMPRALLQRHAVAGKRGIRV